MIEFIKSLLKPDGEMSSKRFVALWAMLVFTAIAICSLCGIVIYDPILYSTVGIVTGALGMTMWTPKS